MSTVAHETGLKIRYGTVDDGGDARAILASSLAMVSLVEAVCAELDPDARLEIRVQSPEPGSVIIGFNLLTQLVGLAGRILTFITKLVDLRKKLKGEAPAQVNTQPANNVVIIISATGEEVRTDTETLRLYEDVEITSSTNAVFEPLAETDTVTRWDILDLSDRPLATVEQETFPQMLAETGGNENAEYVTQRITVPVVKPSFEKDLKWDILFFGERRSVLITDADFWDGIDKGDRFGKGDELEVELKVKKVYDHRVGAYLAKEYEIVKVHSHIPRPAQSGMTLLVPKTPSRRYRFDMDTGTNASTAGARQSTGKPVEQTTSEPSPSKAKPQKLKRI